MTPWLNNITITLLLFYMLIFSFEFYKQAIGVKSLVLRLGALGLVVLFLYTVTGFPFPDRKVPFGGRPEWVAVLCLYLAGFAGVFSRQHIYGRSKWSWKNFFKALVLGPVVSFGAYTWYRQGQHADVSLWYLGTLAYVNGFAWRTLVERFGL